MTASRAAGAASLDLRVLRALPFATVCVLVSALGHACAGGGPVPLPTLLVGLVVVLLAATALAGRERGLPAIVGGLAVGELGLHTLFHLCAAHAASAMPGMPGMPGMAGTGIGADPVAQLAARLICGPMPAGVSASEIIRQAGLPVPVGGAGGGTWTLLGLTPLMLLGHLLAALVAGWWLRRGEAAVFRLLGLALAPLRQLLLRVLHILRALLGDAQGRGPRVPRFRAEAWRLPARAHLRHQLVRRGPPALLA